MSMRLSPRSLVAKCFVIVLCCAAISAQGHGEESRRQEQSSEVPAVKTETVPLSVDGEWLPGALLLGKTLPGARVVVLGHTLMADAAGGFVFGLGRDQTSPVVITVDAPESGSASFEFPVKRRKYDVQRVEGVESKYVSPPEEVLERIASDAALVRKARDTSSARTFFRQAFQWPAEGPVTGVYGSQRVFNGVPKRPHFGLDIAGPVGTPVVAPVDGVVTLAHPDMYYSGGTLILDHGQGISSSFIHLSEILVKEGEQVAQGQLIARIGATGRVTGPHLDWRVNWYQERLDPQLLLPPKP